MSNEFFRKTVENARKHRDIKFVTTSARRKNLMSKPNYHTTKEIKGTRILRNKPAYWSLSILEIKMEYSNV